MKIYQSFFVYINFLFIFVHKIILFMETWDETFLKVAKLFSDHSTCARLHVGAVLVKNKRIISCGYNGTPSGSKHCNEIFKDADFSKQEDRDRHHEFSLKNELHAEQNCIAFAAKSGVKIDDDCTIYITTEPCTDCAKLIVASGIKNVVFGSKYDRTSEGTKFLIEHNINIKQA